MQPHGTPCWLDLTTDLERAKAFYGEVLGWTFLDLGPAADGRVFAEAGGAPVAALKAGSPSDWQVFLRADDADAVVVAATERGATAELLAGDVGVFGRVARLRDPSGAPFGLWQPGAHPGFVMDGREGAPAWFEVNTRDSEGVRDFFAGLFGHSHERLSTMTYFTLHAEGAARFGVLQMDDAWEGMEPAWMAYFGVRDPDAAAARVGAAGGTVAYGPFDTPYGRIVVCKDPMGTPFSLMRPPEAP